MTFLLKIPVQKNSKVPKQQVANSTAHRQFLWLVYTFSSWGRAMMKGHFGFGIGSFTATVDRGFLPIFAFILETESRFKFRCICTHCRGLSCPSCSIGTVSTSAKVLQAVQLPLPALALLLLRQRCPTSDGHHRACSVWHCP